MENLQLGFSPAPSSVEGDRNHFASLVFNDLGKVLAA
jgi:hypothetical protein